MPSFARELEQTLHNALAEASRRRHEYATLEHLLIALIDDEHAAAMADEAAARPIAPPFYEIGIGLGT